MQKKKIILLTILILIILSIALLILNTPKPIPQPLTEQAKANYTTEIGTQTYDITNAVLEPNEIVPTISAGTIPIKWNGANFVITTFEDTNWYDYANGKPAYIMLNDGYYQSELIQNMQDKELAKNAVGNDALVVANVPNNNPTIYMYIPRFAYNNQGEILYIKQGCSVAGTYAMPEIFTYETQKVDFSLAGIWIECTPLANTSEVNTKINNMKGENNKYGFIANTIATNANNETSYKTTIETYNQYISNIVNGTTGASSPTDSTTKTNTVGAGLVSARASEEQPNTVGVGVPDDPQITDNTNPNRTILKITNSNQPEPIKGNAYYDETEEKIKIEVTYRTNAITKIINSKGNILSENSTIADSGDEIIGNKTYKFIVIDNLGNQKQIQTSVTGLDIYIIENEDDLKLFRDAVNSNKTTAKTKAYQIADVKMNEGKYTINEETGDITFASDAEQWIPIGNTNSSYIYNGKYYGGNYSIFGIYINNNRSSGSKQGLFSECNGLIQDLTITESYIKGINYVGGFVGYSSLGVTINNCINRANVDGTNNIGGIIGKVEKYGNIERCGNEGMIKGNSGYVGGISGYNSKGIIDKCYNLGSINGKHEYVGGIVAFATNITIESCYNVGKINNTYYYTGGICGRNCDSNITYCYNLGKVIGQQYVGGITSHNDTSYTMNCYNVGDVSGYNRVGGIVGWNSSSSTGGRSTIKDCYNIAENISASQYKGAICGENYSSGIVESSYYIEGVVNCIGYERGITSNCIAYSDVSQIPAVISIVNGENAFVEDTNNINNGYPILAWQVETTE